MFKKMFIVLLAGVVMIAIAVSVYNTVYAQTQLPAAAAGQGNGRGQGNQQHGGNGDGSGVPAPQNGLTEWVTYSGVVSSYAAPGFSLLTQDGQSIAAELGNVSYLNTLGLALQNGDKVTVTGFLDTNGGLALKSLTLESTGQTYNFRDDLGRPLWAGGRGRANP